MPPKPTGTGRKLPQPPPKANPSTGVIKPVAKRVLPVPPTDNVEVNNLLELLEHLNKGTPITTIRIQSLTQLAANLESFEKRNSTLIDAKNLPTFYENLCNLIGFWYDPKEFEIPPGTFLSVNDHEEMPFLRAFCNAFAYYSIDVPFHNEKQFIRLKEKLFYILQDLSYEVTILANGSKRNLQVNLKNYLGSEEDLSAVTFINQHGEAFDLGNTMDDLEWDSHYSEYDFFAPIMDDYDWDRAFEKPANLVHLLYYLRKLQSTNSSPSLSSLNLGGLLHKLANFFTLYNQTNPINPILDEEFFRFYDDLIDLLGFQYHWDDISPVQHAYMDIHANAPILRTACEALSYYKRGIQFIRRNSIEALMRSLLNAISYFRFQLEEAIFFPQKVEELYFNLNNYLGREEIFSGVVFKTIADTSWLEKHPDAIDFLRRAPNILFCESSADAPSTSIDAPKIVKHRPPPKAQADFTRLRHLLDLKKSPKIGLLPAPVKAETLEKIQVQIDDITLRLKLPANVVNTIASPDVPRPSSTVPSGYRRRRACHGLEEGEAVIDFEPVPVRGRYSAPPYSPYVESLVDLLSYLDNVNPMMLHRVHVEGLLKRLTQVFNYYTSLKSAGILAQTSFEPLCNVIGISINYSKLPVDQNAYMIINSHDSVLSTACEVLAYKLCGYPFFIPEIAETFFTMKLLDALSDLIYRIEIAQQNPAEMESLRLKLAQYFGNTDIQFVDLRKQALEPLTVSNARAVKVNTRQASTYYIGPDFDDDVDPFEDLYQEPEWDFDVANKAKRKHLYRLRRQKRKMRFNLASPLAPEKDIRVMTPHAIEAEIAEMEAELKGSAEQALQEINVPVLTRGMSPHALASQQQYEAQGSPTHGGSIHSQSATLSSSSSSSRSASPEPPPKWKPPVKSRNSSPEPHKSQTPPPLVYPPVPSAKVYPSPVAPPPIEDPSTLPSVKLAVPQPLFDRISHPLPGVLRARGTAPLKPRPLGFVGDPEKNVLFEISSLERIDVVPKARYDAGQGRESTHELGQRRPSGVVPSSAPFVPVQHNVALPPFGAAPRRSPSPIAARQSLPPATPAIFSQQMGGSTMNMFMFVGNRDVDNRIRWTLEQLVGLPVSVVIWVETGLEMEAFRDQLQGMHEATQSKVMFLCPSRPLKDSKKLVQPCELHPFERGCEPLNIEETIRTTEPIRFKGSETAPDVMPSFLRGVKIAKETLQKEGQVKKVLKNQKAIALFKNQATAFEPNSVDNEFFIWTDAILFERIDKIKAITIQSIIEYLYAEKTFSGNDLPTITILLQAIMFFEKQKGQTFIRGTDVIDEKFFERKLTQLKDELPGARAEQIKNLQLRIQKLDEIVQYFSRKPKTSA